MLVENMAALVAFSLWLVAFALGYVLRYWVDDTRAEFVESYNHGEKRRVDHGRR